MSTPIIPIFGPDDPLCRAWGTFLSRSLNPNDGVYRGAPPALVALQPGGDFSGLHTFTSNDTMVDELHTYADDLVADPGHGCNLPPMDALTSVSFAIVLDAMGAVIEDDDPAQLIPESAEKHPMRMLFATTGQPGHYVQAGHVRDTDDPECRVALMDELPPTWYPTREVIDLLNTIHARMSAWRPNPN